MELVEHINNKFVSNLYVNQDFECSGLGFFSLNNSDHLAINLHIKKKPRQDITKWGAWGEEYNVVVIKLILQGVRDFSCQNVHDLRVMELESHEKHSGIYRFVFKSIETDQHVMIEYTTCIFQGCDIYLDS